MKKLIVVLLFVPFISFGQVSALDYFNRGIEKFGSGDYYGAIADFTEYGKFMPNDGEAYRFKGFCKGIIGDMKGAYEDWRKAVSLGDSDSAVQLEENGN